MDLIELATSDESVAMKLRNPNTNEVLTYEKGKDKKKPITLQVVGTDHPAYKKVERRIRNKLLKDQSIMRGKIKLSAAQLDEQELDKAKACLVGWEGVTVEGKLLEFNPANVDLLLTHEKLEWIQEQLTEFCTDRENFMQASS